MATVSVKETPSIHSGEKMTFTSVRGHGKKQRINLREEEEENTVNGLLNKPHKIPDNCLFPCPLQYNVLQHSKDKCKMVT